MINKFGEVTRITSHEVAHQIGATDTYINDPNPPEDDLMAGGIYHTGSKFYPKALNEMRMIINPNK